MSSRRSGGSTVTAAAPTTAPAPTAPAPYGDPTRATTSGSGKGGGTTTPAAPPTSGIGGYYGEGGYASDMPTNRTADVKIDLNTWEPQFTSGPATTATGAPLPQGGINQAGNEGYPSYAGQPNASRMTSQQSQPWNVNTAAAQGLQSAMAGTQAEMNYRPDQITAPMGKAQSYNATSYNPSTMSATGYQGRGYNATTGRAQGYGAANVGSTGYNAAGMQAGQLANTDLSAYKNQYESDVISGLQGDALRSQQMASNELGAQATRAGAFGGSRHGIAEGTMAAENQRNLNNQIAGLRQSGFQNAQQMGLADIGNRMTAAQANQAAQNTASQFGASAANQAALSNQAAQNVARQFGAGAQNQMTANNLSALNAAGQFGAQAQNVANQFTAGAANTAAANNMGALNAAGQFGAQAQNAAGQFNAQAANNMTQANQNAAMQAMMANQTAGLAGSQQRLGAANQMGGQANTAFNMGQTLNNNLSQQGAMQQALQQMVMDRASNQYAGYQQSPYTALSAMTGALGASPSPMSAQTSQQRGLFDYLGMGASIYPYI